MKLLMPKYAKRVKKYRDKIPLFVKENIEEDCVLCLGEGSIIVIENLQIISDREANRNTEESNIYRGRSPLL